jgi:beta-lactamase class A
MIALLGCSLPAKGQAANDSESRESPARADVEKLIQNSGADVSVAFRTLDGTQFLFIQADKPFRSSSAIKIAVMFELYAQAEAGELRLSDPLLLPAASQNAGQAAERIAGAKDDPTIAPTENTMTLRELCEEAVAHGSLRAEGLLIERLGVGRIRERLRSLGAADAQFVGPLESDNDPAGGPGNTSTARDLMALLWALAKGDGVNADDAQEMIGMFARAIPYEGIAAGLPGSKDAALGTAGFGGVHQEAAIVYGPHSFVIVILVRGVLDRTLSYALSAQITHALAVPVW